MTPLLLAGIAAVFIGFASAAQHHATQQVDHHPALHPGLVVALVRRPWWLFGTSASVVGLALQATALAIGSIIEVQTVMISSLAWTAVGESLFARRLPHYRVVAGVVLAVAGIVGVLLLLRPRFPPDPTPPDPLSAGSVVAGCAILAAAGLLWAARGSRSGRALGLALATGVGYGLTAALIKLIAAQVRHGGLLAPLSHPAVYAAVVIGPAAVLLSQNTLQHGRLASPALTIVLLLDPLVGVATGILWFGEQLGTTPLGIVAAAACAGVAIAGVAVSQTAAHAHDPPAVDDEPVPHRTG